MAMEMALRQRRQATAQAPFGWPRPVRIALGLRALPGRGGRLPWMLAAPAKGAAYGRFICDRRHVRAFSLARKNTRNMRAAKLKLPDPTNA